MGYRGLIAALLLVVACGSGTEEPTAEGGDLGEGKFDKGAADLLEGHGDAVAEYLREAMTADRVLAGDYRGVLDGVAAKLGCQPAAERTFAILLTRADLHPRLMFNECASDPTKASEFFLSTQSDDHHGDIESRDIKMAAWDKKARRYRLYEMKPLEEGGMKVQIEPTECLTCHTGPTTMDADDLVWRPVMNELVNPWTLWNAEPDFRSHQFEDAIDPEILEQPVYKAMTAGKLDAAANFEPIVRAGIDRVTNARALRRHEAADLATALSLVRPLFCDETLNYVSENHDTGKTAASVIIDDAIRHLFFKVQANNWPWDWANDGVLRLTPPAEGEAEVAVIPVRGEATLQVELSLVSRKVLDPIDVLRVRALDWKHPVFSDFRCGLFLAAEERLWDSPPEDATKNADLIRPILAEIMKLEDGRSLVPEGAEMLFSIPDTTADFAFDHMAGVDLETFGYQLDDWFNQVEDATDRAALERERARRACRAIRDYPSAPLVPGVDCPSAE